MPHKVIYSRFFLERVHSWSRALQDMAFKAAEQAAIDPNHTDYSRGYLTPYKQKHPTSDHQYTLYFEIINTPTSIFVCWINDDTCLHDTRMSYGDDPCLKEFSKIRASKKLEKYDPNITIFNSRFIRTKVNPSSADLDYLEKKSKLILIQIQMGDLLPMLLTVATHIVRLP